MNRGLPSQPEQICAFAEPSDDERRGGLCLYQWSRKWGRCFTSSERINHASILPTPNHLTRERRPHSMLGTENALALKDQSSWLSSGAQTYRFWTSYASGR